jgi:uncharacterized protein (DUF433 family)
MLSFSVFRISCFRVPPKKIWPRSLDRDFPIRVCSAFIRGLLALIPFNKRGFQVKIDSSASWISKKADRCGGDACIRDTRIPVWALINYRRLGGSDADLLRDYPGLTPADLEAASEYHKSNPEEIERAIRENEEELAAPRVMKAATPSSL